MNRLRIHKIYRPLVAEALARGWTLTTRGKHPKLTAPDGSYSTPIPSSDSPGLYKRIRTRLHKHPSFMDDDAPDPR